ncbi:hypothetical protein [Botrimarina hoheduenensis]|nr:hypothetical protein [Botrimarina hoheduenensis]
MPAVTRAQADPFSQFNFYFGPSTAGAGNLAGFTVGPGGEIWLAGTTNGTIRRLQESNGVWSGQTYVGLLDLALFHRSEDVIGGITNPDAGGVIGGSAASILLNPAPLTINVTTGTGGTQAITYPAGTIAYLTDAVGVPRFNGVSRPDVGKKVYSFDLRQIDEPTSVQPDYDTASSGPPEIGGIVFGEFGFADWNDVLRPVVSERDLQIQAGSTGSDSFGRQFAWSSDGQWIYAVDSSVNLGGIYRIDPKRTANSSTGIARVWDDGGSDTNMPSLRSEPAILSTSVRNFAPGVFGMGDQIIVEGSRDSGNSGGMNVFFDNRTTNQLAAPQVVFTEQQFRSFADYYSNGPAVNGVGVASNSVPRYFSIASDSGGNLYFWEQETDALFRYDTQGRFIKIASEREQDLFQTAQGVGTATDEIGNLTIRTSTAPGFPVTEIMYADAELDAPVGIFAYKPGDFDRDNDVDAADLSLFAGSIGLRNTAADDEFVRFDLNGNEVAFLSFRTDGQPEIIANGDQRLRHTNNEGMVVDWKDVKILQQFVDFPNGDTNFDFALNFTDLDVMAANYYTLPGQNAETWVTGDFASIDPDYFFLAPDVNLVNEVDLAVIAEAWINDLGQPAPSDSELMGRGYTGQFLADAIAAFGGVGGLDGDYDRDGDVDGADYATWVAAYGAAGVGLDADGNRDGVIDVADYTVWRDNTVINPSGADFNNDGFVDVADYTLWRDSLGQTGVGLAADGNGDGVIDQDDYQVWKDAFGLSAAASAAVPEPSAAVLLLFAMIGKIRRRGVQ